MTRPIAVVTGAGGGMGRAIALDLARTHHVHALARRPESVAGLPEELGIQLGDLRDAAFLDRVASAAGEVDVQITDVAVRPRVELNRL